MRLSNDPQQPFRDDADHVALESFVEPFESAWQRGECPAIPEYLPPDGPERPAVLVELVHVDLERRLKKGESARVEAYFVAFPDLLRDESAAIELIGQEFRLRRRSEPNLRADEFRQRFPQFDLQLSPGDFSTHRSSRNDDSPRTANAPRTTSFDLDTSSPSATSPLAVEDPAAARLELIGRYRISAELGSGGFGAVYRAFDPELRREVAVKIPLRDVVWNPTRADAYLAEAQNVARLDHPGIVPVYDAGRSEDGRCYFVSKLISGGDLAGRVQAARLSAVESAAIVADVAEALHHAHQRGLVHRDIKPANILLDDRGRPLVADFGLAMADEDFGKSPRYLGTLAYMSPEQARGQSNVVDARSDIYSLGIVLFELLTGERPYRSKSQEELLHEIAEVECRPPRQLDDSLPAELDCICVRALAKHPADRYSTALDMARDLRNWLAAQGEAHPANEQGLGLPTSGRAAAATGRTGARRRGYLIAVAAAVGCGLLIAASVLRDRLGKDREEPARGSPLKSSDAAPAAVASAKVEIVLDVVTWNPQNPARRGLPLKSAGALPVKNGDQIRVEAQLPRPGYAYLIWIDAAGIAAPIYPWTPGRWDQLPARQRPVNRLSLPEAADQGWPMRGGSGMETVMLLVRAEPLPIDVNLADLLAGLPPQQAQTMQSLAYFADGDAIRAAADPSRGPDFFDPQQIDDPVLRTQRQIQERLGKYFPTIRAVSFAHQGD